MTKQNIIDALRAFLATRPGFDPANYGDRASYLSEMRRATQQLGDARRLLREIELRDSIKADDLLDAAKSGRLDVTATGDSVRIDYTCGQYWPTEYRAGVPRLCAHVLWDWKRDNCMPTECCGLESAKLYPSKNGPLSGGDWLRASFRREYGRGIASRYFS